MACFDQEVQQGLVVRHGEQVEGAVHQGSIKIYATGMALGQGQTQPVHLIRRGHWVQALVEQAIVVVLLLTRTTPGH